jgi:hypothetical protein
MFHYFKNVSQLKLLININSNYIHSFLMDLKSLSNWCLISILRMVMNDRIDLTFKIKLTNDKSKVFCIARSFDFYYFVNLGRIEDYECICTTYFIKCYFSDFCIMVDNHSEIEWLVVFHWISNLRCFQLFLTNQQTLSIFCLIFHMFWENDVLTS